MSIEEINKNHENFKKATDAIDKLRLATKNCILQMQKAKEAMQNLKEIALFSGFEINEKTGELIEIK